MPSCILTSEIEGASKTMSAAESFPFEPGEATAANEAAAQTTRLTVIEGGQSAAGQSAVGAGEGAASAGVGEGTATAVAGEGAATVGVGEGAAAVGATEAAGAGVAVGAGEATGAGVATGVGGGLAAVALPVIAVAAVVLSVVLQSDPPEPPSDSNAPVLASKPQPNPAPVSQCSPQGKTCDERIQDLQDVIDRNKRDFGNRGIHGLQHRWQELITGPCGPGQLPYRVTPRGEYVKNAVWEVHVKVFNDTKNALWNRFKSAVDAGCTVPDDLMDEAMDAEKLEAPTPDMWKGDPARPCVDSPPPPNWNGPPEDPGSRGL